MPKLKDVLTISTSTKPLRSKCFWLLNLDMVEQQTGNVLGYNYVNKSQLNGSIIQFDTNTVLYSKLRPNLNKVVLPLYDGFATSEMLPLKPDPTKLLKEYLAVYLRSDSFVVWATSKTTGAKMPRLATSELMNMDIPLPSLDEQRYISNLFDNINRLIILRKQQLSKLDELVKARFVELFGLPVSNLKKWDTEKMKDIAPAVNYSGDFEETVWLLNLDMIEAQTGRIIDYLYVSENEVGNSTCTFDTSNVLYSKLRPYLNKVVIPDRCGYATSEMIPLKPNPSKIERTYLAFMLRSDEFVNMINEKVAGAKMPRVSMGDFIGFDVPVPPMELQKEFTVFVEQTDKSKSEIQKSLEKLETLKKALMQKYFG